MANRARARFGAGRSDDREGGSSVAALGFLPERGSSDASLRGMPPESSESGGAPRDRCIVQADRETAQRSALSNAAEALRLTQANYQAGTINYLQVIIGSDSAAGPSTPQKTRPNR